MPIEPSSIIVCTENLMSSPMDDELVILNMDKNNYIGLDEIGRRIWELFSEPRSVEEACGLLSLEFESSPAQIAADVLPFLEELRGEGLIRLVE